MRLILLSCFLAGLVKAVRIVQGIQIEFQTTEEI